MQVTSRMVGTALVLSLDGELTATVDTWPLHECLRRFSEARPDEVVVDLGRVRRLDCSGVGELVRLHRQVLSCGGNTTLVNVAENHRQLLQVLGLGEVLQVRESSEEALTCRPRVLAHPPADAGCDEAPPPMRNRGFAPLLSRRLPVDLVSSVRQD